MPVRLAMGSCSICLKKTTRLWAARVCSCASCLIPRRELRPPRDAPAAAQRERRDHRQHARSHTRTRAARTSRHSELEDRILGILKF